MKPTPIIDDEACWQAVVDRDRSQDGKFVTAVRTTGIYCRPSCPARTPHRENVEFYRTPAEAEAAGFRACKRCSPNTQAFEADLAEQICRYVDAHLDQRLSLEELGGAVVVSPQHLQRMFKRALGISPREYIAARRLDHLKTRLKAGDTVTEAMYDAGFSSSSRLYENAPEKLGMTPADYRSGARGLSIRYTVAPSSLGYVLAAATERGICAVMLDDEPDALSREALRGISWRAHRSGWRQFARTAGGCVGIYRGTGAAHRTAVGYTRYGLPTARMASTPSNPLWRNPQLQPIGRGNRAARSDTGSCQRYC